MLEFNLHKTLRGPDGAFDLEINLQVANGEVLALYGPSGAGKTTVLRMIAGLIKAGKNKIRYYKEDWQNLPPGQRKVGFVFQDYGLFPNMTVAQNITFAGGPSAAIPAVFELGALTTRYPHELSGGQQQRVALARSLVQGPVVLLLDEPLSALDRSLRRNIGTFLRQAVQERNIPCILVSHDPEDVLLVADRVARLEAGKVVATGEPAELLLHPATEGKVKATVLRLEDNRMLLRIGQERVWVDREEGISVGDLVLRRVK